MGRNSAKFLFAGKPVSMYQPTDAQGAVIFLAVRGKGDQSKAVIRFFSVLENLVVKPSEWERMEELMITGAVSVKDFSALFEEISKYDWPKTESE